MGLISTCRLTGDATAEAAQCGDEESITERKVTSERHFETTFIFILLSLAQKSPARGSAAAQKPPGGDISSLQAPLLEAVLDPIHINNVSYKWRCPPVEVLGC